MRAAFKPGDTFTSLTAGKIEVIDTKGWLRVIKVTNKHQIEYIQEINPYSLELHLEENGFEKDKGDGTYAD